MLDVSIPLSRDSLCNYIALVILTMEPFAGFNPSVEGQPLQQHYLSFMDDSCGGFNPSVEGQPLQQHLAEVKKCAEELSFNPSVEGQPLQLHITGVLPKPTKVEFQSLCRGTAFATQL